MTTHVTLPNLISMARILAVPLVIWLMTGHRFDLAFWGFALAGISDGVDGFIAKHWNLRSKLGAFLDPLADKLLLVSSFITLGIMGHLPVWFVILTVARDILIVGGILLAWIMGRMTDIAPSFVSKTNTTLQIVLIGAVLLTLGFGWDFGDWTGRLIWLTAAMTVLSGGGYLVGWMRMMSE